MMGQAAASLAFLSANGPKTEKNQKEKELSDLFKCIHGDVKLIDMKFMVDKGKIISKTPQVVSENSMENDSDVAQTMKFTFTITKGKTSSATHTVNFRYGIGATFSAGFPGIGEFRCQLSFDFSQNHSFKESINQTITKSYEFDLIVPAHGIQDAIATVQEAEMEIPYELVFDFQGTTRSVEGLWKGVACSDATYTISKTVQRGAPEPKPDEWQFIHYTLFFVVIIFLFIIIFCFYRHF